MDSFSGRIGAGVVFCVLLAGSVTAPACSNGGGVVPTDAGVDAQAQSGNDVMADAAFDAFELTSSDAVDLARSNMTLA